MKSHRTARTVYRGTLREAPACVRLLHHMSALWAVAQHFRPEMLSRNGPTRAYPPEQRQKWARWGGLASVASKRSRQARAAA